MQARIDQYFSRIAEIIKKGKVPARIKFMLQDVQELRGNSWVPRQRQEQSLKTIDQVREREGGGREIRGERERMSDMGWLCVTVVQTYLYRRTMLQ